MNTQIENFEIAFSDNSAGCVRKCDCGITYFDSVGTYSWEENEIETLISRAENKDKCFALDYSPGVVSVDGKEFVDACKCWHKRAEQIIDWIERHDHKLARWLTLEKKRKQQIADNSPVVG